MKRGIHHNGPARPEEVVVKKKMMMVVVVVVLGRLVKADQQRKTTEDLQRWLAHAWRDRRNGPFALTPVPATTASCQRRWDPQDAARVEWKAWRKLGRRDSGECGRARGALGCSRKRAGKRENGFQEEKGRLDFEVADGHAISREQGMKRARERTQGGQKREREPVLDPCMEWRQSMKWMTKGRLKMMVKMCKLKRE